MKSCSQLTIELFSCLQREYVINYQLYVQLKSSELTLAAPATIVARSITIDFPNVVNQLFKRFLNVIRFIRKESERNPIILPLSSSFLLRPLPFLLWFRARWYWQLLHKNAIRISDQIQGDKNHIQKNVIPYNLRKIRGCDRFRTERLINILRSVQSIKIDQARVLTIGPRNEVELLLLRLYGFKANKITAIDLFSYSPHIQIMDMHNLAFPDDSFDVTYSAYTLRYSDKVDMACCEIARCTRSGGLVAISFVTENLPVKLAGERGAIIGTQLYGGVSELLEMFSGQVESVLWREEYVLDNPIAPEKHCSVIFRLAKQSA